MSKRPKVYFSKPRWGKNQYFWNFWNTLDEVIRENFPKVDIEYHEQDATTFGINSMRRDVVQKNGQYDLFLSHHLSKRYNKSIDYKDSYYNHLWYFNNGGYSGFSEICNVDLLTDAPSHDVLTHFYEQRVVPCLDETKYKSHNEKEPTGLPSEFFFVPLQVEKDSVMKLKNITTDDMLYRVIEVSKELDVPVVIKRHPKSPERCRIGGYLLDNLMKRNKNVISSDADVRDLIDRSSGVFTINSGVGFESTIRMKPTFIFGKSDYEQVANQNKNKDEIVEILNRPVDQIKTKTFLYNWWKEIIDLNEDGCEDKMTKQLEKFLVR